MGNSCCGRSETKIDFSLETSNLKEEFDDINRAFNPFFYYSLLMIESQEQKFINSGKNLLDFINVEYSYIINSQFKLCYNLCRDDLDKIIDNKNVADIVFYNLVFLTLSNSYNILNKKEEICYTIINKYIIAKGQTDYSMLIESVKCVSSICSKITIIFLLVNFFINLDQIEMDHERIFIKGDKIQYSNPYFDSELGLNKNTSEISFFEKRCPSNDSPFIKIGADNIHNLFFECMFVIYPHVKVYYPYDKYIDKTVNYALNKLFFRKNIFSDLNKDEIKAIIDDVIDLISCENLFNLLLKQQ